MYWDMYNKELKFGNGIYDEGAIVWAFNENEDIVNWGDIGNQEKHDFTEEVEYHNIQPGDVFFIDYNADSCYNEVGMVVEPVIYNGETCDIIRIIPGAGVCYDSSKHINMLYDGGIDGFVDYRSLPDDPKGGHSPYPKVPTKFHL